MNAAARRARQSPEYRAQAAALAGCREILLVVNPADEESYRRLFADGRQWGLEISYAVQPKPGGIAEVFLVGRDGRVERAGLAGVGHGARL